MTRRAALYVLLSELDGWGVATAPGACQHAVTMRSKPLLTALFAVSLLATPACGGLISQSISVQKAVETKSADYDVEKVGVAIANSRKTVTVYMNTPFNDAQKQEIIDTAMGVVPDAAEVKVVKFSAPRENVAQPRDNQ